MRALAALLIATFSAGVSLAEAPAGFCGQYKVSKLSNKELRDILFTVKLQNGVSAEGQCGLFHGEDLPICGSCSNAMPEPAYSQIRPLLGRPDHLHWHVRWHSTRTSDESEMEPDFIKKHLLEGTVSGEDFFYMHRLMLKMFQAELVAKNLPCLSSWNDLPELNDREWPLPKKFASAEAETRTQNKLRALRAQLVRLRNPEFLRKHSLNRFGQIVEADFHQELHQFYRGNPLCSREAKAQGFCDDLIPLETSPLNKYFWKLHGLIDGLIGDWLTANGYEKIAPDCRGLDKCYQWQDVWDGEAP